MELQKIIIGSSMDGKDGDTNRTAWERANINFEQISNDLYNPDTGLPVRVDEAKNLALGAQTSAAAAIETATEARSTATVAHITANNAIQKTGGTFTGYLTKVGVFGQYTFRITNSGTEAGIGGSFGDWNGNRTPALQIDAQDNTKAYGIIRSTRWGGKHIFGQDVYEGTSGPALMQFSFRATSGTHVFFENGNATFLGALTQNSDYRIKSDLEPIIPDDAAEALIKLKPLLYIDTRDEAKARRSGFIAHELAEIFPHLVDGKRDAVRVETTLVGDMTPYLPGHEPDGYVPPTMQEVEVPVLQNVNYIGLIPYLVAAWIHSENRIVELERKINAMK